MARPRSAGSRSLPSSRSWPSSGLSWSSRAGISPRRAERVPVTNSAIPRLTTERLLLREWHESDRQPFAELNADPEVARYLGDPMSREASDALIDRIRSKWATDGHGLWALERRDGGDFIGFA